MTANAQSDADLAEAAEAFDRGTNALLDEDFVAAAHFFERAYRLAPSPPALVQAVRANAAAGNELRAATLALALLEYEDDAMAQAAAEEVLAELRGNFVLVRVNCSEDCLIAVNGSPQPGTTFFVEPGRRVRVSARFPGGELTEDVRGEAGDERELSFEAPPPPPEPVDPVDPVGTPVAPAEPESGGLPPALFVTAASVGLGLTGVGVWSAVDHSSGEDDYNAAIAEAEAAGPTSMEGQAAIMRAQGLLDDSDKTALRTNLLLAAGGGMTATAVVIAIFTDWSGQDDDDAGEGEGDPAIGEEADDGPSLDVSVGLMPGTAYVGLEGHF